MADKQKTTWFNGNKKTYCLITGASRGMGREIAKQFSANVGKDSIVLLVARNVTLLEKARKEIAADNPKIKVSYSTYDLSKPDANKFRAIIKDSLSKNGAVPGDFQQVAVVHNAATISTMRKAVDYGKDPTELADDLAVNVISPMCLNNVFLEVFASVKDKVIVEMTSNCALEPMVGFSLYAAGQAARNLYLNTLATEEKGVSVIHYSPGPVDTDMYHETTVQLKNVFPKMSESFKKLTDDGELLTCETTIKKLLKTLQEGDFDFEKQVDYYDLDYYKAVFDNTV